jgi:hypothetical protein
MVIPLVLSIPTLMKRDEQAIQQIMVLSVGPHADGVLAGHPRRLVKLLTHA